MGGLLTIAAGIASFPVPGIPSELIIVAGLAIFAQGAMRAAKIVLIVLWMGLLAFAWIWLL